MYQLIRCDGYGGNVTWFGWIVDVDSCSDPDYPTEWYAIVVWDVGEKTCESYEPNTFYGLQGDEWRLLSTEGEWRAYICR